MELRCKNVVAGDSHGDFLTVERRSDGQVCFCRFGVIAVNKIKPSTVGDTVPHGMFAGLRHLIPAHLRNFEACTGLIHTVGSKANDVEIARHIVEIKASIDRIKEQVQNVE